MKLKTLTFRVTAALAFIMLLLTTMRIPPASAQITTFTISGNAGVAYAILSYTDGTPLSVTANSIGDYTLTVSNNWSGTVTPSRTGYAFVPSSRTYSNVIANMSGENYAANVADITYYVDNTNISCNDLNDGLTPAYPFCTIGRGAGLAKAGNTVRVLAGTYPEKVKPANQGSAGNPITFSAAPGVTVTGDGSATGSAFRLTERSYITVDGFTVTGNVEDGIYTLNSNNITISNNHVSYSGNPISGSERSGIYFNNTTNSVINGNTTDHNSYHGIMLTGSCSNIVISNNVSFANAMQYLKTANGIMVNNSSHNTLIHNVTYANEDSGLGFYDNASYNLILGNVSYGNGDHGIDNNASPNNIIVGNSTQGNVTVGINLEGAAAPGSGSATVQNNISVDNGINPPIGEPGNIRVDAQSLTGTTLDYNIVFHHSSYPGSTIQIIWGASIFDNLSTFQLATGQEMHGLQSDPLWVNPAPPATRPPAVVVGDYHLSAGSPAIDSANSDAPFEPTADIAGNPRVDDPMTPNTGAGTRTYDDRGAFEYQRSCYILTITPGTGGSTPVASPTKSAGCATTGQYYENELINLAAAPDANHYIASWSGTDHDTSTASTNTVTMPASAHTVGVNYAPKITPTLSVTNSPVIYNGSPQAAVVVGSVAGVISNVRYNGSLTTPTNAGTYAVTANFIPTDTTHYNSLTGASAGNFVINRATPTLSVTNSPVIYNGSPQAAVVIGSVAGVVSNIRYNGSRTVPTNAGTYAVTANFTPTDTTNYARLTNVSAGNFIISRATPTLSVTNSPVIYDGSPQAAVVVGSVAGIVSNVRYNGSLATPTNTGTYAVTADFAPNDAINYNSLSGASAGNFVINPAHQGLTLAITPTPTTFGSIGDVINYSYLLTNSGDVPLMGPLTVTDDKVIVTCPATPSLAPLDSITCTASYTITLQDITAGSVTNMATATGHFAGNPVTSNIAQATISTFKLFLSIIIK
jgi:parallel beta-helix repeat protein